MMVNKIKKLRLNISNLQKQVLILSLVFLFVGIRCFAKDLPADKNDLKVIVFPEKPKQGDTVSVKIKKHPEVKNPPKVYFEKSKQAVFEINDTWYRSLIPLTASKKPGTYGLDVFYDDKKKNIDLIVGITDYIVEELTLTKEVAGLMTTPIERKSVGNAINAISDIRYWDGKFSYPSSGKQSTPYGVKRKINGVLNESYFHKGLDFAVPTGSKVNSPAKGKVILAGHQKNGFVVNGNCVFVDHGHGVVSAFLHLSEINVKEEDIVEKGQLIGKVGGTGIATGPHLHWGIYVFGQPVEPELWVKQRVD